MASLQADSAGRRGTRIEREEITEKTVNVKKMLLLSKRHSDIHALAEIEGQLGKRKPLQQREATNSSQYRTGSAFLLSAIGRTSLDHGTHF